MNIFKICDKRHGRHVLRSGEASSGKKFALSFLREIEISPTHCRNLKYDAGQEILHDPTRHGAISQQEITKFATCKQWTDWNHNGIELIFNYQSPSSSQGRNV